MNIWGLADLHLSFARPKPMDVFGDHWLDHAQRLQQAWRDVVAEDDLVCLPGDLSWAMRLPEVDGELQWLARLPGRKVLLKGNHDYWWSSLAKVRRALPEGVYALQNDALLVDGVGLCGARGWVDESLDFSLLCPGGDDPAAEDAGQHGIRGAEEDRKIYQRELSRLETSLRQLPAAAGLRVALLHFPPTSPRLEETPVTRLLERYAVDLAVFGHLHGPGWQYFRNPYGERNGVQYFLVSADFAHFRPVLLTQG